MVLYCGFSDKTVDRLWTVGIEVRSDNTIFQVISYHSLRRSYKHVFNHILSQIMSGSSGMGSRMPSVHSKW